MIDEILEGLAVQYGVTRRELTIGQIEDFFVMGLQCFAMQERKERKKEDESFSSSPHTPYLFIQREEIKEIKESLVQILAKLCKSPQKSGESAEDVASFTDEFEALWKQYPRKRGKKDALRHYIAARKKKVDYQTISDGLDAYNGYIKRNGVQPAYVKLGSSWFCEWSWEDDYTGDYRTDRKRENLSDEEAERIAREVLYGD